ncbi:MAG: acyl-ACP--UDP-N-acetylglucosamine O-acyltransferase [Acidobacteriota bacterium]
MAARIHPSAVVDPHAELADGVEVGPHAVIGADVRVGEGTVVGAGVVIQGPTQIGRENRIFGHACLGFDPQDLKFAGEPTRLEIGDRNHIREFVSMHRGTGKGGGLTRVGSGSLFMAYSHVAHDCRVGDRVIFANAATLAGHVEVGDDSTVGAFSAVHQFCRVGRHAYIGGFSVIVQDALPFVKTVGQKPASYGLNRIGLERKGFDAAALERLEMAVRLLTRAKLSVPHAVERIRAEVGGHPEVDYLIEFVEQSQRGVIRGLPGRRTSRGGGAE